MEASQSILNRIQLLEDKLAKLNNEVVHALYESTLRRPKETTQPTQQVPEMYTYHTRVKTPSKHMLSIPTITTNTEAIAFGKYLNTSGYSREFVLELIDGTTFEKAIYIGYTLCNYKSVLNL